MRKVVIGIQARSASTRLPNKIHLQIGGKSILQSVIDTCQEASKYLQKDKDRLNASFFCCVLMPEKDPGVDIYKNQITVLEGSSNDVLSRYIMAQKHFDADYVARITSDCFFLQSHLIAKHIKSALIKERDYTTNCLIRTFKEGMDVQVFSRRLMAWLEKNSIKAFDKEHVGAILHDPNQKFPFKDREGRPSVCHILNTFDESEYKTSIDTKEEFDKAKWINEKFKKSKDLARRTGIFIT